MGTTKEMAQSAFGKARDLILKMAKSKPELGIIDASGTLTADAFIVDLRVAYKGEQGVTIYFKKPTDMLCADLRWHFFDYYHGITKAKGENVPLLRIARIVFNSCTTLHKGRLDHLLGKRIIIHVRTGGEITWQD